MRLGHIPALNGLRGLAIGAVVAYHAYGLPGGFLGVDLFFVLSGFLITALLLEERADTGRISLRSFYRRRARRLLPVAVAGILFAELLMLPAIGGPNGRQTLVGLFALFYVENLAHFLHPPVTAQLGHYWSLSQEEQFYLVWPPLLLALSRVPRRLLLVGLVIAATAVIAHRMTLAGGDWRRFYYAPDARVDGMLAGCGLAVAWNTGLLRPSRGWGRVGLLSLFAFAIDAATMHPANAATAWYGITVANAAAVGVIAAVLMAPRGAVSRLLAVRPLVWLGAISYSLYIWQPLVSSVGKIGGSTMALVSLGVAVASYKLIEEPFRARRQLAVEQPSVQVAVS